MRFIEFYNEKIVQSMSSYESSGLIDEMRVYGWVVNLMKQFGTLFATMQEEVIDVNNYESKLPDGFIKLKYAYKCTPDRYEFVGNQADVIKTNVWIERHEKTSVWGSCDDCCEEEYEKSVIENVYFKNTDSYIKYFYKKPTLLRITEAVVSKQCTSDCPNLKVRDPKAPSISILKNSRKLKTSFEKDNIILGYYGYEKDEDGFIIIPESNQGDLENYLEYAIKAKILEDVILNGDAVGNEMTMLQYNEAKAKDAYGKTITDAKASVLTPEARKAWIRKNKQKMLAHEFAFKI